MNEKEKDMLKCLGCRAEMNVLCGISVGNPLKKEKTWLLYRCTKCGELKTVVLERIPTIPITTG